MTPKDYPDYVMPNSRRIYVNGELHPQIRVPFREISQVPTKALSGELEPNEPIRVYDTSGPWGDADVSLTVEEGLPALRADWIRARADVEAYEGRIVRPQDDGYLSEAHAEHVGRERPTSNLQRPTSNSESNDEAGSNRNGQSNSSLSTLNYKLST